MFQARGCPSARGQLGLAFCPGPSHTHPLQSLRGRERLESRARLLCGPGSGEKSLWVQAQPGGELIHLPGHFWGDNSTRYTILEQLWKEPHPTSPWCLLSCPWHWQSMHGAQGTLCG